MCTINKGTFPSSWKWLNLSGMTGVGREGGGRGGRGRWEEQLGR